MRFLETLNAWLTRIATQQAKQPGNQRMPVDTHVTADESLRAQANFINEEYRALRAEVIHQFNASTQLIVALMIASAGLIAGLSQTSLLSDPERLRFVLVLASILFSFLACAIELYQVGVLAVSLYFKKKLAPQAKRLLEKMGDSEWESTEIFGWDNFVGDLMGLRWEKKIDGSAGKLLLLKYGVRGLQYSWHIFILLPAVISLTLAALIEPSFLVRTPGVALLLGWIFSALIVTLLVTVAILGAGVFLTGDKSRPQD